MVTITFCGKISVSIFTVRMYHKFNAGGMSWALAETGRTWTTHMAAPQSKFIHGMETEFILYRILYLYRRADWKAPEHLDRMGT